MPISTKVTRLLRNKLQSKVREMQTSCKGDSDTGFGELVRHKQPLELPGAPRMVHRLHARVRDPVQLRTLFKAARNICSTAPPSPTCTSTAPDISPADILKAIDKLKQTFEAGMEGLSKRVSRAERCLDFCLVQEMKREVAVIHGKQFCKQETCESILDLVELIPKVYLSHWEETRSDNVKAALDVGKKLVDDGVPLAFLKQLHQATARNETPIDDSKAFDINEWKHLRAFHPGLLKQVDDYIKSGDHVESIARDYGLGISMLIFAIDPTFIFDHKGGFTLYDTLEFELRGCMNLSRQLKDDTVRVSGIIEAGECEATLDFDLRQLSVRLAVLDWLVSTVNERQGVEVGNVSRVGHIFVPKVSVADKKTLENEMELLKKRAMADHKFILDIHVM